MFIIQSSGDSGGVVFGFLCCLILPALAIYFIWKSSQAAAQKLKAAKEALQAAHEAYQQALANLKQDPGNPDLKQRALHLGRHYSGLTRSMGGQGGVTVYDEMALMNDINAACAAYSSAPQQHASRTGSSVEERLARLAELKARGIISDEEYNEKRQSILDEL